MKDSLPVYWGNLDAFSEEFAEETLSRYDVFIEQMHTTGMADRIIRGYRQYHNRDRQGADASDIAVVEDGGQLDVQLNEFRNLVDHKVSMATAQEPSYQPFALNTDSDNLDAVGKVKKLIEYYQKQGDLGVINRPWAEVATVTSAGWALLSWDKSAGEPLTTDGTEVTFDGDISIEVLNAFEVAYDTRSKDPRNPTWVVCRPQRNKFELAALYPKHKDAILSTEPASTEFGIDPLQDTRLDPVYDAEGGEDYIRPYLVMFRPSALMPSGRMALVLDGKTVLRDGPLPYSRVSAVPLIPDLALGEDALPYGSMHDLLPLVEAMQAAFSTLTSGHAAQVQVLWAPDGAAGYDLKNLGNFKLLEGGSSKPETLNLYNLPQEAYSWYDRLQALSQRFSMLNDAVMGQADASDSGSKLAYEVSTSMQAQKTFTGELSRARAVLVGLVIEVLRTHMSEERVIAITGAKEQPTMLSFRREDLGRIKGVAVAEQDPVLDTPAGRKELADMGVAKGMVNSIDEYVTACRTGRTELFTDGHVQERVLILRENEQFLAGDPENMPVWCESDRHKEHAMSHLDLMRHDNVRRNPQLKDEIYSHVVKHIDSLTPGSQTYFKELLDVTNQKSLMAQDTGMGMAAPAEMQPAGAEGTPAPDGPQGSQAGPKGEASEAKPAPAMPSAPKPPGPPPADGAPPPPTV